MSEGQLDVLKAMIEDDLELDKEGCKAYVAGLGQVNLNTFHALLEKKLIVLRDSGWPVSLFKLTRKGSDVANGQAKAEKVG